MNDIVERNEAKLWKEIRKVGKVYWRRMRRKEHVKESGQYLDKCLELEQEDGGGVEVLLRLLLGEHHCLQLQLPVDKYSTILRIQFKLKV